MLTVERKRRVEKWKALIAQHGGGLPLMKSSGDGKVGSEQGGGGKRKEEGGMRHEGCRQEASKNDEEDEKME